LTKAIDALDYIVTTIRNARSVDEARQWLTGEVKTMAEVKSWKGTPSDLTLAGYLSKLQKALKRLEAQLESTVERHGRRASLVGHSRGGTMARVLAVRRPDLIRAIVCLGSPLGDQFDVHPLVRAQVRAVATLGTLGLPGVFSHACQSRCCVEAMDQVSAPFPEEVRFTSVFSRSDGVVAWRACLDPAAQGVQVPASHVGMAVNAEVYRVIAQALAADAAQHVGQHVLPNAAAA